EFEEKIRNAETNGDFFYLIREYISAYHDGHFAANVPSRRAALFPVLVERIQGQVIVDTVLDGVPPGMFPFTRGDRIVAVNGRPVEEEVKELSKYVGSGNPESELREATWALFYRTGNKFPLPK